MLSASLISLPEKSLDTSEVASSRAVARSRVGFDQASWVEQFQSQKSSKQLQRGN